MNIIHFYHQQNELQARYVSMLTQCTRQSMHMNAVQSLTDMKQAYRSQHYDILHIHGCWSIQYAKAADYAISEGTRVVISPHGELEPWILKNKQWQEKMPKTLFYQRQTIQSAYAVIAMGTMEYDSLKKLGWNPRIETVRNALITKSITQEEMVAQLSAIYQKIMDSDPVHMMTDDTRRALFTILKASTAGHPQWLQQHDLISLSTAQWRQIMHYAQLEQIESFLNRGIRILGLKAPDTTVHNIPCYLPVDYTQVKTIAASIGNMFPTENERLLATFKFLQRQLSSHRLTILHLLELEREIREHDIDEGLLCETLEENRLLTFASRLMGVLNYFTNFEEGLMPVAPLQDRQTKKITHLITNHLKI